MANKQKKRIPNDKSSRVINLPGWLVIVLPVVVAFSGIYLIYNSFATPSVKIGRSGVTDQPSQVYVYCSANDITLCYEAPLLHTIPTPAFVRKISINTCVSGFQYTDVLQGDNTKWKCLEIAGD